MAGHSSSSSSLHHNVHCPQQGPACQPGSAPTHLEKLHGIALKQRRRGAEQLGGEHQALAQAQPAGGSQLF